MKRVTTSTYVLTLPLACEKWQNNLLNTSFGVACKLSNLLIAERKKALIQLERRREWKNLQKKISKRYSTLEESKKSASSDAEMKQLFQVRSKMLADAGFSEYSFQNAMKKYRNHYKNVVNSQVAQKLASSVWKSFEQYLYGNGKEIHFCSWKDFSSIEGKSSSTGITFDGNGIKFRGKFIPVVIREKDDYTREALNSRVKYCRIRRRWFEDGFHYYVQLVLEGNPPKKWQIAHGKTVGIDAGTQTMAAVSENGVLLTVLAEGLQSAENEIRRINRAMDRSRRASNPKMFNEKGEIIRRNQLPKECLKNGKRIWNESERYRRLAMKKRSLLRKQKEMRIHKHKELANRILSLGDEIYVESMNYRGLQKKAAYNPENHRKRRKRFGKSIANRAPALFLTILEKKAADAGGSLTKINTWEAKVSQYNHQRGCCEKKQLSTRWNHMPDGRKIQRDLYSAFLIMNINEDLSTFNEEKCNKHYEQFVQYHDEEMSRLKKVQTVSSMGL